MSCVAACSVTFLFEMEVLIVCVCVCLRHDNSKQSPIQHNTTKKTNTTTQHMSQCLSRPGVGDVAQSGAPA